MRKILFRKDLCTRCSACAGACAAEHRKNYRLYDALSRLPMARKQVRCEGHDAATLPHAVRCAHCDDPACVDACISRACGTADRVFARWDRCVGCFMCVMNCPLDALIPVGTKAVKCDACLFTSKPACVRACPTGALIFEEADEKENEEGAGQRWRRRDRRAALLKARRL